MDPFSPSVNQLQEWIDNGRTDLMRPDMARYIEQLDTVRSLHAKYHTQHFIIKTLQKTFPDISRTRAYELYNDSLNFFYSNNEVKKDAWRNIYAEKLEQASLACWEKNDFEGYRRCIVSAAEVRGLNMPDPEKLPEEFYDRRVIIYQMDPKKVGIPQVSRVELASFIDNLPDLSSAEKFRLQADAGIINIELFELVPYGNEADETGS